MGFFTKDWISTQTNYRETNFLSTSFQEGINDISNIGRALATHAQSLWHLRNKDVHDTTPSNHHGYRHILLQLQLQELYDKQPRMMAADRDIFNEPLEVKQQQSHPQIKAFIKFAKPLVKISIARAKEVDSVKKTLTRFFRRRPMLPHVIEALLPP